MLWFDVGVKRYTTNRFKAHAGRELWFDVGVKRYTTIVPWQHPKNMLWFDVGVKRYTTDKKVFPEGAGCGLM